MQPATLQTAPRPLLELTAADLMSAPVMTIPESTTLQEAARLLARSDVSGAPVVDGQGRCVGVLSSRDFVAWAGAEGEATRFLAPWGEMVVIGDAPDNELRHYMTAQPVWVEPTAPIGELAQKMIDAHIRRLLVVVEGGRPRGVVTSTDLLAALAREAARAALKPARRPRKKAAPQ